MIDPLSLASTGLAFFLVAVSPGPATLSGLVFWGVIAASGMGALLQSSVYVLMVLKILGGIYLLWLAFQSGRAAWRNDTNHVPISGSKKWFMRGLLLNLSNPKSVMAWMAALSIGINPTSSIDAVVAATLVCIIVGFATNGLYSILFSINGMMRSYQRFRRQIQSVVAALFTVAGLGLIRSAFSE